jgi:hypothetical protein
VVGVGWGLGNVQGDGAVLVDGVCIVELHITLTHVHGVCVESVSCDGDGCIVSSIVR